MLFCRVLMGLMREQSVLKLLSHVRGLASLLRIFCCQKSFLR
jgi:hypothetical protein